MKVLYARKWFFLFYVAVCFGCLAGLANRASADAFTVSDRLTDFDVPEQAVFAGNFMIWEEDYQLFSRNLATGEVKQLTDTRTYKIRLAAGGDYAVYLDNQQEVTLIYLPTGEIKKAAIQPAYYYENLHIDGHYLLYQNKLTSELYIYDINTEQVSAIGKGNSAAISSGMVVYLSFPEGSMELFDAGKGTTRRLLPRPEEGYIHNRKVGFNGKQVVWLQHAGLDEQVRMLNIDEQNILPQVLYISKEPAFDSAISIGSHTVAWRDGWKTTPQQVVVGDLDSRQTEAYSIQQEQYLGMVNEQLAFIGENNKLTLRTLQFTGNGQAIKETLVSALPHLDFEPRQVDGMIGGSGNSRIITDNKQAAVSFLDGDTSESNLEPRIVIDYAEEKDLLLTKALQPGQIFVSHPWNVTVSHLIGPLKLSLSYMEQQVPSGGKGKLGIYRLDSTGWVYMGGLFDQSGEYIYTEIMKSGTYAVLYQDVPQPFVRDYYLQKRIIELNANKPIRVFLEGEELNFDHAPILKDGSTTVQFRPVFEKLGLQIEWNGTAQRITGNKAGYSLQLTVGQTESQVNGEAINLPVAPFIEDGNTFVPLRFIGEATGLKVLWDENLKAVYLYDPATEGKLYYDSGALMYEGQLKNRRMNGKGKLYQEDGSLWYDAEFRDQEVEGWGTLYFAGFNRGRDRTGEVSIGKFAHGRPQGYVVDINDNGYVIYEGEVIQGIFNGQGKYYVLDQLLYEGQFKDNLFDGYGKLYRDGRVYFEGQFVKHVRNGKGKEYFDDGSLRMEAEYANGGLNGKAIKYFKSGEKEYEGEFEDNSETKGTFYYKNGSVHVEFTRSNDEVYSGTIYYENGEKYVGEFWLVNLKRNGQGTLYDKEGNIIHQGQFQYDEPVK